MILVEITAATNEAGTPKTFYLSTAGFVTSPTDIPANTAFEPRLKDAGTIGVAIFADGQTSGSSKLQPGSLALVNIDGALDGWKSFGFDGRPVVIRQGKWGVYPDDFPAIFSGTVDGAPDCSIKAVEIKLRDKSYVLDQPVLTTKYAGTNVGPVGLEGGPEDLKGRVKPRAYGKVFNISPPCVNSSKLTYQVSDGAVTAIPGVYDRGAALTVGADHATSTALTAATVAPGTFQTCLAEGLFRLGSSPVGQITCDAAAGANDAARTAAQTLKVLAIAAGVTEIDTDHVTQLDFLTRRPDESARPVGIWLSEETSYREAMDQVAASHGVWWAFDPVGTLRMGQLNAPAAGSTGYIIEQEVLKGFERRNPDGSGIPVWRVTVRYKKLYTVQDSDLAGSVSDARRGELAQEFRSVTAEDASVKVKHIQARELVVDTLLTTADDAQAEADRLLSLHRIARDLFDVPVAIDTFTATRSALGGQVNLTHGRFGLSAGRDLIVLGIDFELALGRATLSLWG